MNANSSTKQGLNGSGPAGDKLRVCLPVAAFVLMTLCWTTSDSAERPSDDKRYFNIPQQRADLSLTQFAEQAGLTLLFKFNIAKRKTANNLTGHYTVNEAVEVLLADTGLHPVFSDQGQLMSVSDDMPEAEGSSMDTKKKAGLIAVLAGVLAGGVNAQAPTVTETEIQTSVVTGTVTDARTGRNLSGAKVTIEETGQWTSTGDLGRFRFVGVPSGSVTLTVTFLGYAEATESVGSSNEREVLDIQMESLFDEIVVMGQRSARAQALNLERTADNFTTVLSADQLGTFNGTTISEALRRAPGVAFEPDEATGTGANIIIRGLEPDFNQVRLNGVRLLDGTGEGRAPNLGNFLTENIDRITINKTLLPSQDSNGAGGLVEIRTKSALDRDRRFASFGMEYGQRGDDNFGESFQLNSTVSGIFGINQNFGVGLSVSYREEDFTRVGYLTSPFNFGEYLPEGATSSFGLDPRILFPLVSGADSIFPTSVSARQGTTDQETLSLSLNLAKEIGAHTELRFDYTRNDQERTTADLSTFTSINGGFRNSGPIEELGGQVRNFFAVEDASSITPGIVGRVQRSGTLEDIEIVTDVASFSGSTAINRWLFNYGGGFSRSIEETPDRQFFDIGFRVRGEGSVFRAPIQEGDLLPEVLTDTRNGLIVSVYEPLRPGAGNRFILPRFNESGFAFYNDVATQPLRDITIAGFEEQSSEAITARFSARRAFATDYLDYLEAGFEYQDTEFETRPISGRQEFDASDGVVAEDLGIVFGRGLLTSVGAPNDFNALSRGNLEAVISNLDVLEADGLLISSTSDTSTDQRLTQEESFAGYVQSQFTIGNFEIIGGVRVDRLDITSTFFDGPRITNEDGERENELEDTLSELITESVSQTDVLPRLLVNYRASEDYTARFGYFQTASRPQIESLTQRRSIRLDLERGGTGAIQEPELSIFRGNPDLEPALTHNFDLSYEYFTRDVGVIKAGAFYKIIENPIQFNRSFQEDNTTLPAGIVLPDDPIFENLPDDIVISVSQPSNQADDNTIWGAEFALERQFDFLPEFWSGFGVYVNYTYTDSESTQELRAPIEISPTGVVEIEGIPFEGSPKHSGTFGFTYRGRGFDGSLLYSAQDRRLSSFEEYGLHLYDETIDSLDFRLDYLTNLGESGVRIFVRGTDLLSDADDAYLENSLGGENGVPKYYTGGTYFGGRSISIGFSSTF